MDSPAENTGIPCLGWVMLGLEGKYMGLLFVFVSFVFMFFLKQIYIMEVFPKMCCGLFFFIWNLSVTVKAFLQIFFELFSCSRGTCDTGLRTRGFPTALPLTQQTFQVVRLSLALPQPRMEVWSFLFVQSARNQFSFTWQACFSELFS